jgi:hypothetical protein
VEIAKLDAPVAARIKTGTAIFEIVLFTVGTTLQFTVTAPCWPAIAFTDCLREPILATILKGLALVATSWKTISMWHALWRKSAKEIGDGMFDGMADVFEMV